MLDSQRLRILHRFGTCGSITATAASLGYSASAVSQQLATLERETGAVLLERTARSATLTDTGRLLVGHAAIILAAEEQAESDLAARANAVAGRVVVHVIPNVAEIVAIALADVARQHPDLEVIMRETLDESAVEAVVGHLSDIAVIDEWAPQPVETHPGLAPRVLLSEPVGLAVPASHPLADHKGPLTGRQFATAVATMTWLCTPEGYASRAAGDERLERSRTQPRRRWEFEGLITIAGLVSHATGCALLPRSVARTQPAGRVNLIPLTPGMRRHVLAVTRTSTSVRPSVAVCLDAMADRLAAA